MAEQVTTSQIDPAIRPFLTAGLERAQQLFLTGKQPTFFPGQTYVSPSAATQQAIAQQEALARAQSPLLQQAQQTFLSGMGATSAATPLYQQIFGAAGTQAGADIYRQASQGGFVNPAMQMTQQTASGGFLQGSPYQQQMIEAATRPLVQQYAEQVVPGIASGFSAAGRYGSGAMQRAQGQAAESFARGLGDVTTGIVSQDYARERGFQEAARQQLAALGQQDVANRLAGAGGLSALQQAQLGTQLQAAGGVGATQAADLQRQLAAAQAAPSIYAQQYIPSQQLAQVGAAQEAISAQKLQDEMARFQFGQQLPYQQLSGYLSSVYGNPMGSYGQQVTQLPQNTLMSGISGAGLGYLGGQALGSVLPSSFGFGAGTPFSLSSPTSIGLAGAGLGGLLGFF